MQVKEGGGYRPDIDGIRAVAVILVVVFHYFPAAAPGGYVGVDVFFVISGYLITGIIAREVESGSFTFREFYSRRIRRIFPALAIVLAATFVMAWRWLLPDEFVSFGQTLIGGATFAANFVLLNQSGYFDTSAHLKPLLHLWSLGIEEQFYIVWPIIIIAVRRFRASLTGTVMVLLVGPFSLSVWMIATDPVPTFYLPFTRAWELMVGSALAVAPVSILYRTSDNARSVAGVGLIAAAAVLLNARMPFPGWLALMPTIGAALLISSPNAWINRSVLAHPCAVYVGLISYPLYLWHWPLITFANITSPEGVPTIERVGLILFSVFLSTATYHLVERRLRSGANSIPKIAGLATAMVLVGTLGAYAVVGNGVPSRLPEEVRDIAAAKPDLKEWRVGTCFVADTKQFPDPGACIEKKRALVLVWGDSLSASVLPGLREIAHQRDFGIAQFSSSACPPLVFDSAKPEPTPCWPLNRQVLGIVSEIKPEIVVLQSIWWHPPLAERYDIEKLGDTVARLRQIGVGRIVVVGPVPNWEGGLPQSVAAYFNKHRTMIPRRTSLHLTSIEQETDAALRKKATALGVDYVSAYQTFCNHEGCLTRVGDGAKGLTAWDNAHLTIAGSRALAQAIAPLLDVTESRRLVGPPD